MQDLNRHLAEATEKDRRKREERMAQELEHHERMRHKEAIRVKAIEDEKSAKSATIKSLIERNIKDNGIVSLKPAEMKQFLMDHFNINVSIKSIYNYNAALLRDDSLDNLVHSNSQLSVLLNCGKVGRTRKKNIQKNNR